MAGALLGMDMSAGLPDFVMMESDDVNEDKFMDLLKLRFEKDRIYTYIGEQVVSVNPFRRFPEMYTEETLDGYRNRYMYEVPPHIYALGDDTFRQMMQSKENQCVIITGESGAGKTEASKILMQYISAISRGGGHADVIKNKLLESNPVLEAFGNAKTLRNDNSSRFGKYMEIMFDGGGGPVGGKIIQYLLEKSRVVTRAQGERSFHIFYFLLSQKNLLAELKLEADPSKYHYLECSGCYTVDNMNDAGEFRLVEKAMKVLGMEEDKMSVWRILSAILHIGNVTYVEGKQANVRSVAIADKAPVEIAAELLQCEQAFLERALTQRTISTGVGRKSSTITVPLDMVQAHHTRDSLAKVLYNKLFTWVVDRINENITVTGNCEVTIGMLDIYGFEIFDSNSFEQFCINYCNEKLQQLFIRLVLQQEQEEYVREGIEWTDIDYFDNSPICQLIEGKPRGLYAMIDEACVMSNNTVEDLCDKLDTNFKDDPHYASFNTSKDKSIPANAMRIKHYAGDVTYHLDEFMYKNADNLYIDLLHLLQSTDNQLLQQLFPVDTGAASKKRPPTAGTQFKKAVAELITTLAACQPHYIRCIKSNDNKKAGQFDDERIRHQVRYLNLVETVRVRRAGFCNRQPYERFVSRYKMISKATWPKWEGSDKDGCVEVLNAIGIKEEEYRLGNTKLFIRDAKTLFAIETARIDELPKVIVKMQAVFRGYRQWKWYTHYMAARRIQSAWRGWYHWNQFKLIKAAVMIQKIWKGYHARIDWEAKKEDYRKRRLEMLEKLKKTTASHRIRVAFKTWMATRKKTVGVVSEWYIRCRERHLISDTLELHKNDKTDPTLGRHLGIPEPWERLSEAHGLLAEMHKAWWVHFRLAPLDDTARVLMRQKILGYDLFSGKKKWNPARQWTADYINTNANPMKEKYTESVKVLFQQGEDSRVLFSDFSDKINRKGKPDRRVVIVTEMQVYKYQIKNYKQKKDPVPLDVIKEIVCSPGDNSIVIIKNKPPMRDLMFDIGVETPNIEKVSEFCTVLVQGIQEKTGNVVPVTFADKITFNNSRDEKSQGKDYELVFDKNPKPNPNKPGPVYKKAKDVVTVLL